MADVSELGRKVKAKYPGVYNDLDDADLGRRVKAKHPGAYDDFTDTPATVLPQNRQEFRRPIAPLNPSATPSPRVPEPEGMPALRSGPLYEAQRDQARRQKRQTFDQKPVLEQYKERAVDALTRGGGQVSRMARQTVGAGLGVARGLGGGDFTPVDLPEWRKGEEGRFRTLEARRQARPSSFATETAEGVLEALPSASLAALGGIASGGSLPAAAAMGGGMAAAGADWRDPKRAAAQTALGAVAPVVGGKLGQVAGGAVASRLARPVAQAAARGTGEVVGGAAGNVIGSGTEQLAFEGQLNPRELAKQAVIGGTLNVPGAIGAARRPARLTRNIPQDIPAAQPVTARQQPEVAPVAPRVEPERQTATLPRPPARQTAEIPAVPTAPTRQIQYPDAPETQEMPAIRERIAAENATTKELPATTSEQPQNLPAAQLTPDIPAATLRLPKATDENIAALRAEQEQLGRLAYDRRGDFTGDLRDEYNRLNSVIREYDNARTPGEFTPPARGPERMTPPPGERAARREALQPKTGPMPETLTEARKVTQEFQVPGGLKVKDSFSSREDARQGHFERFDDEELVQEIRRMEEVQNQATRGRSKLTRAELEANRFDLKVAVDMQKERGRLQRQIGVEPADRIETRAPGRAPRKIQHSQFGAVTEAPDQGGMRKGQLRVVDDTGKLHVIKNPRISGNREASFVKGPTASPAAPMQAKLPDLVQGMKQLQRTPSSPVEIPKLREQFPGMSKADFDSEMVRLNDSGRIALHRHDQPASLSESARNSLVQIGNDYFTAATFRDRPGQVMGMGLGGLQGMFERGRPETPPPGQQALFESGPKRSLAKRTASNVVSAATLPRALMASADLSAPLRQGAILTLPPTQWGRAAKSGVRMIQALKTSRYKGLVEELNAHPDAKTGKEAGLYMATDPKKGSSLQGREEDFISKWAEKIPIVKHSEQAYKTYLDSIRLETFRKYKRVIDGDEKLSFEDKHKAYKAAAEWINVASGRGSLGKTLDKAMPALSTVFFAPRYTASRVQVLNPATYLKNSSTPAGRAVLKQQMTDLVQFAGMVSATLALAKAAGAEVGTDPEDSDFLKIKVGNVRYDTLAGLQQVMRLFYRTGKDVGLAAVGKKSDQGENALDVAGRFARSKLAPIPSFFVDALAREDFIGREFDAKRGIAERMIPLMWKDFAEAYQREGFGGTAKLTPGLLGVGVQDFAKKAGVLSQKNEAYMGELRRLGVTPAESARRLKDEPENLFKGRANKIQSWRDEYGAALIQHPMYQRLSDEQKKAAVESLHSRISAQANEKRPNLRQFSPAPIVRSVREGERSRRRTDRDKIYVAPD